MENIEKKMDIIHSEIHQSGIRNGLDKDGDPIFAVKKEKQKINNADINKGEKQTRYRIQFDVGYRGSPGKIMDPKSKTVPDMSLTIRQLLEDHTRGNTNEVVIKKPVYFDMEIPNIYDLTDVDKYRQRLEEQLTQVNKFIETDQEIAKTEEAARLKAKIIAEMQTEESPEENSTT